MQRNQNTAPTQKFFGPVIINNGTPNNQLYGTPNNQLYGTPNNQFNGNNTNCSVVGTANNCTFSPRDAQQSSITTNYIATDIGPEMFRKTPDKVYTILNILSELAQVNNDLAKEYKEHNDVLQETIKKAPQNVQNQQGNNQPEQDMGMLRASKKISKPKPAPKQPKNQIRGVDFDDKVHQANNPDGNTTHTLLNVSPQHQSNLSSQPNTPEFKQSQQLQVTEWVGEVAVEDSEILSKLNFIFQDSPKHKPQLNSIEEYLSNSKESQSHPHQ